MRSLAGLLVACGLLSAPALGAEFQDIDCGKIRLRFDESGLRVKTKTCQAMRGPSGHTAGMNPDDDFLYVDTDRGFVNLDYFVAGARTRMRNVGNVREHLMASYGQRLKGTTNWSEWIKSAHTRFGPIRYQTYDRSHRRCIGFTANLGLKDGTNESIIRGYACGPNDFNATEGDILELLRRITTAAPS